MTTLTSPPEGDALQTLARDLFEQVDLLRLDGAKALYPGVVALVAPHLRPGAFIAADNANVCAAYRETVRPPGGGYLSASSGEDVELSIKL